VALGRPDRGISGHRWGPGRAGRIDRPGEAARERAEDEPALVVAGNGGCGECGGHVPRTLLPLTWNAWRVSLHAC
jgi:hypothetical protein